jgi:carboxyl-terminal processing protease
MKNTRGIRVRQVKKYISCLFLGLLCVKSFAVEKGTPETYRLLNIFSEAFRRARSEYVDPVTDQKLIEAAIQGMLSSLDSHSSYLNQAHYQDLLRDIEGKFGGIGVEVTIDKGLVKIISPLDGSPSFKEGLLSGDIIVEINHNPVTGWSLEDVVDQLKGRPGETVTLKIQRKDFPVFEKTLTKERIILQTVFWALEDDMAYIRLSSFTNNKTSEILKKAVQEIIQKSQGKLKGVILDLRNNIGGLFEQAVDVSDLFLEKGEIVSIRGKNLEAVQHFSATPGDILKGLPLVVLINQGTASSAEIVAGALQDNGRAIIIGDRSFGKGSVQSIFPIPPGYSAIRLTTSRYYTPSGKSIQDKGITPDIVVAEESQKSSLVKIKEAPSQSVSVSKETSVDLTKSRAMDLLKAIVIYKNQNGSLKEEIKNGEKASTS